MNINDRLVLIRLIFLEKWKEFYKWIYDIVIYRR